jgi:hypothetical protein
MGKGGGYRPAVYIWPSRHYGVAILTNQTRYDPRPLAECVPPLSERRASTSPGSTSMVEHARQAPPLQH